MRIFSAALLASVSLAAMARADETAIRVVPYSALTRTQIVGIVGEPTTITFPKGEQVYRVAQSGKPTRDGEIAEAGWQAPSAAEVKDVPLGNNLTLWPAHEGDSTMTVITVTPDGVQKTYAFRMVAKSGDVSADTTLNLIFKGEGIAPATAQGTGAAVSRVSAGPVYTYDQIVAWKAKQAKEKEEAELKLRTDSFNNMPDGCGFHAKGKQPTSIEPRCPMTNGQWTLIRFPGLSKKPAVYIVTGENDERLARQHEAGDIVAVEEIAQHFRLRLGEAVLDIWNDRYDPVGNDPGTGTIAPTVHRDLIQAKANN
jgi:type IV secretory pathway VirB9-like protein